MKFHTELNEMWGEGSRFGFVKISRDEVYWYALHSSHKRLEKSDLLAHFEDYDPIVSNVISKTELDKMFQSEILDLNPIPSWFKNNVCLLGDAAHATTPNMGQGACQAIEDAHIISHYISKYDPAIAFSKYESLRKAKADMIVDMSWRLGLMRLRSAGLLPTPPTFLKRKRVAADPSMRPGRAHSPRLRVRMTSASRAGPICSPPLMIGSPFGGEPAN